MSVRKAVRHLREADRVLGVHIADIGPCRLKPERSGTPFYSLGQSIAYQQLTGKAAQTIWGRVIDLYGGERNFSPKRVLKTPEQKLRAAGLSSAKAASLYDLAEHAERRIVPGWAALDKLDDDEIIRRITQVHGIGPWTVQMLLIFSLGRPDVLPTTDFGVQKGFAIIYNKKSHPKPRELLDYGERWRPYRSIASWYLWRATDAKAGRA